MANLIFSSIAEEFFEKSNQALLLIESDGTVVSVNKSACSLLLRSSLELLTENISKFLNDPSAQKIEELQNEALLSEIAVGELSLLCGNGSVLRCEAAVSQLNRASGVIIYSLMLRDISERITLMQVLQAQKSPEGLLARTVSLAKVGGWQVDLTTMKLSWTLETFRIAEIEPPNEPSLEQGINLFAPEARQSISQAVEDAISDGKPYDLELPLITAKGRRIWVRTQGYGDFRDGKVSRIFGTFQDITERKKAQDGLKLYSIVVRSISQGVIVTGPDRLIISVNNSFCEITGYEETEILGRDCKFLAGSETDPKTTEEIRNALVDQVIFSGEILNYKKDGTIFWNDLTISPVFDSLGQLTHFIGVTRDVTLRKQAAMELNIAGAAFSAQEGIIITDANKRILRVNGAFEKLSGYSQSEVLGRNPSMFSSGRHDEQFYRSMWSTIETVGLWLGDVWDRRKNGEIFPQSVTISVVRNVTGQITHYVGTFIDISDIKDAEEKISKLSYFDPLTGLANRAGLKMPLEQSIASHEKTGKVGGLLMINLENFKAINGTLGPDAGDVLLTQVASRLQDCARPSDVVSRHGGDEFVIMFNNLGSTADKASVSLEALAQSVLSQIEDCYVLQSGNYFSTCYIGATLFGLPDTDKTYVDLIKELDVCIVNAKQSDNRRIIFFDPIWQQTVNDRAILLNDLRGAFGQKEFQMHYQAQVDKNGEIFGTEALVRWNHPVRGLLSPALFIPLAEENGLVVKLGDEILRMCLMQLGLWQRDKSMQHLKMSINITADQFYADNFVEQVEFLVREYDLRASGIMFELTESMLLGDIRQACTIIERLNNLGIGFAIDDFGTGYSSLAYLSQLPVDLLKIDQSFVSNIGKSEKDLVIIRTIIEMARTLGMDVLGEGVETEAQRKSLVKHGCSYFQGYLFSRPLPLTEFESLCNPPRKLEQL